MESFRPVSSASTRDCLSGGPKLESRIDPDLWGRQSRVDPKTVSLDVNGLMFNPAVKGVLPAPISRPTFGKSRVKLPHRHRNCLSESIGLTSTCKTGKMCWLFRESFENKDDNR